MEKKLFDSELKVMETLWREGELTAGQLAKILKEETGWNRNTTYTVIKKCIDKGVIERTEPGFRCRALMTQQEARRQETSELIDRMFGGSAQLFFSAFLDGGKLSRQELESLKEMVEKLK